MRLLAIEKGDVVLEIGPGIGFLTRFLVEFGARVVAVELDAECVEELQRQRLPNLQIVHQDFLQFDLSAIAAAKLKVVGNVPYQITTPIVARLLGEIGSPSPWLDRLATIVLTVQKEVAERFTGTPGNKSYSQVTLLVNYFAEAKIVQMLPPECFLPRPEVTSAIVQLNPYSCPQVQCFDHKLLRQIIQAGFRQRRKMLKNNLSFIKQAKDCLPKILSDLGIDPQIRAERLSLKQFAAIANELAKK